ncbi:stage V sporulation protein AE [Bacillus fonticola]|uniref:stage V sporulation protein AE n=1 Tax=Bacillus fonticola TaxID=2728853 RepID=UPI0014754E45|nr:stage V sporulation protein AE [Bacillus fonticola]
MERKPVVFLTDGDVYAKRCAEVVATALGGRCISLSQGNPSLYSGAELVDAILSAEGEPVLIMFDDSGYIGEGSGEAAMKYVAHHPQIEVLGAVAVASHTEHREWTRVDVSIDREGNLTSYGVDKFGLPETEEGRINGDTVYCLDQLHLPIVVGIGDPGKMSRRDDLTRGAPITRQAVHLVLERSGYLERGNKREEESTDS